MPPKQARPSSGPSVRGPSSKSADETKEDPLRAVVVADTFETRFAPFTLERPRCLLPLANVPLIEYTLEFLASAGVVEVFVYAGAHIDQVESYLNASKWKSNASPFSQLSFLRCQASSVGDVMRDLDQKGLMGASGDFIVVSGDVISDFPVDRAMRRHRERRAKDKNAIMTMILREKGPTEAANENAILPLFLIDPTKDRCLHYEESRAGHDFGSKVEAEILKSPELDVRQDLIDCRIDICTPDVLSLWSDNFDNQAPRKDFLYGVLKDHELNGKTIHTYIVEDHYANRVGDIQSYTDIAQDLQRSIAAGLSLENNISDTTYKRSRSGVLTERDVIVARPSRLGTGTVAGEGTSVGTGTKVERSVLGRRCQIGKNTFITKSHIWDDTTVGNNVKVHKAIIGSEVFIGDNCTIGEGALISFAVRIAPNTTIQPGARITNFDQGNNTKKNTSITGSEGSKGWEYQPDSDDEEDYHPNIPRHPSSTLYAHPTFATSTSTLASDISAPESSTGFASRSQSFANSTTDPDTDTEADPSSRFHHDTVAILLHRMQDAQQADDMLSELMGLRFSGGADETQVRRAVASALAKYIRNTSTGALSPAAATRSTLEKYHTLIRREGAEQTVAEQVAFLLDLQRDLALHNNSDDAGGANLGGRILLFATKDLYDLEVFAEEAFLNWWEDERAVENEGMGVVKETVGPFVEWLENAESESESEEDD